MIDLRPNPEDRGKFFYWALSPKGRFRRAVFMLPFFYIIYPYLMYRAYEAGKLPFNLTLAFVLSVCLVAAPWQLIHDYRRWQAAEAEEAARAERERRARAAIEAERRKETGV